jgi:hypothetical protein
VEEVPEDKHITADKYDTSVFNADDKVSLCRVTRGVEGAEPWGIMLQIGTYEGEVAV